MDRETIAKNFRTMWWDNKTNMMDWSLKEADWVLEHFVPRAEYETIVAQLAAQPGPAPEPAPIDGVGRVWVEPEGERYRVRMQMANGTAYGILCVSEQDARGHARTLERLVDHIRADERARLAKAERQADESHFPDDPSDHELAIALRNAWYGDEAPRFCFDELDDGAKNAYLRQVAEARKLFAPAQPVPDEMRNRYQEIREIVDDGLRRAGDSRRMHETTPAALRRLLSDKLDARAWHLIAVAEVLRSRGIGAEVTQSGRAIAINDNKESVFLSDEGTLAGPVLEEANRIYKIIVGDRDAAPKAEPMDTSATDAGWPSLEAVSGCLRGDAWSGGEAESDARAVLALFRARGWMPGERGKVLAALGKIRELATVKHAFESRNSRNSRNRARGFREAAEILANALESRPIPDPEEPDPQPCGEPDEMDTAEPKASLMEAAQSELRDAKASLLEVRGRISAFDGGDRPMSPPVRLLKEERALEDRIHELESKITGMVDAMDAAREEEPPKSDTELAPPPEPAGWPSAKDVARGAELRNAWGDVDADEEYIANAVMRVLRERGFVSPAEHERVKAERDTARAEIEMAVTRVLMQLGFKKCSA